ncbi:unnamed protein product [Ilex paraguariensis]|uniref:Non-haem dioxygenase N-terminal domain-containing protein n=1 Tax=Ilex paraguariensis TaxID=185542 RepID=A0ABC8SPM9_9AQUA
MALSFNDGNSLFNFVVQDGNGVKGLVDSGLAKPPIDLSLLDGPNHDQVVVAIVKAAETLGFFQVVNHGVPVELLDGQRRRTEKIGPLPEAVELDGVAHYREFMFEDYMKNFFGQAHDGKKSLDFAHIGSSYSFLC